MSNPGANVFFDLHGLEKPEWHWSSTSEESFLRRSLGPHEASWYLFTRTPDSAQATAGVNDMYIQISFRCKRSLLSEEKLIASWAEMRRRHILLASKVLSKEEGDNGRERLYFTYHPPRSTEEAHELARKTSQLVLWETNRNQFRNAYLNGPRILSDNCQAYLTISSTASSIDNGTNSDIELDYWLFATHAIGDGIALHRLSNEFFQLLDIMISTSDNDTVPPHEQYLIAPPISELPQAMETLLKTPSISSKMAWAAHRVLNNCYQDKMTGAYSFSRRQSDVRSTRTDIHSFNPEATTIILKKCKEKEVTISDVTAGLVGYSYARSLAYRRDACDTRVIDGSILLYSALNLRPVLSSPSREHYLDYFHLAIGYYTLLLTAPFPSGVDEEQRLWEAAKSVHIQTTKALKSSFLVPRTLLTILYRERSAREYARKLRNCINQKVKTPAIEGEVTELEVKPRPSTALMGISMLGNLDRIYDHSSLTAITLQRLSTGSRQRHGAILLFAYTFAGRLCYCLGYDECGFADQEILHFWNELIGGVHRFLLSKDS